MNNTTGEKICFDILVNWFKNILINVTLGKMSKFRSYDRYGEKRGNSFQQQVTFSNPKTFPLTSEII